MKGFNFMPTSKRVKYFFILATGLVFVVGYFLTYVYSIYGNKIVVMDVKKDAFRVEVVSTPDKLARGLGKRKKLCDSCAMLFVFQKEGNYSFWMKDMLFPLDIIWIYDNKVVDIEKNVQADFGGILTPKNSVDAVLEINAGKSDKLGIEVGDELKF